MVTHFCFCTGTPSCILPSPPPFPVSMGCREKQGNSQALEKQASNKWQSKIKAHWYLYQMHFSLPIHMVSSSSHEQHCGRAGTSLKSLSLPKTFHRCSFPHETVGFTFMEFLDPSLSNDQVPATFSG